MADGNRNSGPVSLHQVLGVWGQRPGKSCRFSGFLKLLPPGPSSILAFLFLSKALRESRVGRMLGALSPVEAA